MERKVSDIPEASPLGVVFNELWNEEEDPGGEGDGASNAREGFREGEGDGWVHCGGGAEGQWAGVVVSLLSRVRYERSGGDSEELSELLSFRKPAQLRRAQNRPVLY